MNDGMNAAGPSNDEYETPDWLFRALDSEFGFTFDAAANQTNAKCSLWTSDIEERGAPDTMQRIFCNPPYSNIMPFVIRAISGPNLWVLILPNRTDTDWFRLLIESSNVELRFFRKRIRFCLGGKEAESPRFGSVVAMVRPRT